MSTLVLLITGTHSSRKLNSGMNTNLIGWVSSTVFQQFLKITGPQREFKCVQKIWIKENKIKLNFISSHQVPKNPNSHKQRLLDATSYPLYKCFKPPCLSVHLKESSDCPALSVPKTMNDFQLVESSEFYFMACNQFRKFRYEFG